MEMLRIRKNVVIALCQLGMIGKFYNEIDDICQEIVLYRLEGKAQHQFTKHFVLDYLIKQKMILKNSRRDNPGIPKICRAGENIDKYGFKENQIDKLTEREMIFKLAKRCLKKNEYEFFNHIMSGFNQKEAGIAMGLCEGRSSQLMKEVIAKLKKGVKEGGHIVYKNDKTNKKNKVFE